MPNVYTTVDQVAAFLGQTFTGPQTTQATTLIGVAQAYIDRTTRKSWLGTPIAAERYDLIGATIYLRTRPVASVELVQTRSLAVGSVLETLVAGTNYELLDPDLGQVDFVAPFGYTVHGSRRYPAVAFISYTPSISEVPADIGWAATLIVANSMMPTVFSGRLGISKAQADSHTSVTYAASGTVACIPDMAQQILDGYTLPVLA